MKEGLRVFVPLLRCLRDVSLRDRLKELLNKTLMNHQFYVEQLLLFNPTLESWLTRDDIYSVKTSFDLLPLAQNVAKMIIHKIEKEEYRRLADISDIPSFLSEVNRRPYWDRVYRQLQILIPMLARNQTAWIEPVLRSRICLLSLIHSRLLMPANWLFPIWQEDYAFSLLQHNAPDYHRIYGEEGKLWTDCLSIVLQSQEALFRQQMGYGNHCALDVLNTIQTKVGGRRKCIFSDLLSMRLLSEYLDVMTSDAYAGQKIGDVFSALWERLSTWTTPRRRERPMQRSRSSVGHLPACFEAEGFSFVRYRFRHCSQQLNRVVQLVYAHASRNWGKSKHPVWIHFNHTEIEKRADFFETALKSVERTTTFVDLRQKGIFIRTDVLDHATVLTIEPDKWDALKDRLPDVDNSQREKIRDNKYSAVSLFDTLLLRRLGRDVKSPMWVPRVYRVLDTMADFDPYDVQCIRIILDGEEDIDDVLVCLPIPSGPKKNELDIQQQRKWVIARYIATTIYNYVVTLGVYSVMVDCMPVSGPQRVFAFTNQELEAMISRASHKYNYKQLYDKYIETYNYRKFHISEGLNTHLPVSFKTSDIYYGSFLGIDIGGTDIKACMFRNGQPLPPEAPLISFSTIDGTSHSARISLQDFCKRIILNIENRLTEKIGKPFSWQSIEGVGISWPGAVRDSRIVGFSRTLGRLFSDSDETRIEPKQDSSPELIHSVDIVHVFRSELRNRWNEIPDSFMVSLENDGNAEAYGNYWELRKQGVALNGGTLVLKLGTSLAGGHINAHGAISPHVAEFSKVILDFNTTEGGDTIQGLARNFISSQGVRDLTRSFIFNKYTIFGPLQCQVCDSPLNQNDTLDFKMEAVEVGQLLTFFEQIADESAKDQFLQELTEHDNQNAPTSHKRLLPLLVDALASDPNMQRHIKTYIASRGQEEFNRLEKRHIHISDTRAHRWQLGVNRMLLLLQLRGESDRIPYGQIPVALDYEVLARTVLGSVALYSQLSLHIAHLVAALYNIYKKHRFNGVVLAGGVLRDSSGWLVEKQTQAFLAKYYDKIFGPTKHLKPGAIRRALRTANPDTIGPFGAAMVANRLHKIQSIAVMEKQIEAVICRMKPGQSMTIGGLMRMFANSRAKEEDVRHFIQSYVSRSLLVQKDEDTVVKTLTME